MLANCASKANAAGAVFAEAFKVFSAMVVTSKNIGLLLLGMGSRLADWRRQNLVWLVQLRLRSYLLEATWNICLPSIIWCSITCWIIILHFKYI